MERASSDVWGMVLREVVTNVRFDITLEDPNVSYENRMMMFLFIIYFNAKHF